MAKALCPGRAAGWSDPQHAEPHRRRGRQADGEGLREPLGSQRLGQLEPRCRTGRLGHRGPRHEDGLGEGVYSQMSRATQEGVAPRLPSLRGGQGADDRCPEGSGCWGALDFLEDVAVVATGIDDEWSLTPSG